MWQRGHTMKQNVTTISGRRVVPCCHSLKFASILPLFTSTLGNPRMRSWSRPAEPRIYNCQECDFGWNLKRTSKMHKSRQHNDIQRSRFWFWILGFFQRMISLKVDWHRSKSAFVRAAFNNDITILKLLTLLCDFFIWERCNSYLKHHSPEHHLDLHCGRCDFFNALQLHFIQCLFPNIQFG